MESVPQDGQVVEKKIPMKLEREIRAAQSENKQQYKKLADALVKS